jgi:hypothetical protein
MTRTFVRRVIVGDSGDAALREIARTKIKLWRDVAANYEDAALRKSKPLHVGDDALEKGNCLATTIGHWNKRLADRGIRGESLRVAAGMADEHSALRDVSKLLQDADCAAERTNALAARIGNDEDFFCKRAHERRDHGAVSTRLGFI